MVRTRTANSRENVNNPGCFISRAPTFSIRNISRFVCSIYKSLSIDLSIVTDLTGWTVIRSLKVRPTAQEQLAGIANLHNRAGFYDVCRNVYASLENMSDIQNLRAQWLLFHHKHIVSFFNGSGWSDEYNPISCFNLCLSAWYYKFVVSNDCSNQTLLGYFDVADFMIGDTGVLGNSDVQ